MNNEDKEIEIDLRELLGVVIEHIILIIGCAIAGALIFGLYSRFVITPQYTSTAKINIMTNSNSMISLSDLQVGSSLANDYEELIKSRPVVESVAENLKLDMSYNELLGCVAVSNPTNTRIIRITATYPDPVVAMQIADEFAEVSKEQISEIMKVDEPTTVEQAVAAEVQSSPNNRRNTLLGFLAGAILAMAFVLVRHILDDTVKTMEDVERYLELNVLAAIPEEGGTDNSEKHRKKRFRGIRRSK